MNHNGKPMIGSGSECIVHNVAPGVVRKDYDSEAECITAYQNAVRASAEGIGPEVFSHIGCSYYTERVRVLVDGCRVCLEPCKGTLRCVPDTFKDRTRELFDVVDLQAWNIGITKDGRFVLIDFGEKSLKSR